MGGELDNNWAVEDPNEEWYNPTKRPKGTWMPEGKVILELLERLQKEKVLELKWKCPGRRPPPSSQPEEEMETEADFDEEISEEEKEEDKSAAFGEFDFDDAPSEFSAKITPRRTPGSTKSSRPQKRVACMDNVLNKIFTQRKQSEAARAKKGLGVRGRRTPIYSTGSPRSRIGTPSAPVVNLFKTSPSGNKPPPVTKSPVTKSVPMEVDFDGPPKTNDKNPEIFKPVIPEETMRCTAPLESLSSMPTTVSNPIVTKPPPPKPSPVTAPPVTTSSVPPLRLTLPNPLNVQASSHYRDKEHREPLPKLLLKIPPPNANKPATSMLLPPGYSRTSPSNKNKSSPGSHSRKSPNESSGGSSRHSPKDALLYQKPPKTPPLYSGAPKQQSFSGGRKTPPYSMSQSGSKTPPIQQNLPKPPPLQQNLPKTPPILSTGPKTPPALHHRSKTPPGGFSGQRSPSVFHSRPKTPPSYPQHHNPYLQQQIANSLAQTSSTCPPLPAHHNHPPSSSPQSFMSNLPSPQQAYPPSAFPPRSAPSPLGSPRGSQPVHSPSRISPQSPSIHNHLTRPQFYPIQRSPTDQQQMRAPLKRSPPQPRPKTPPAYYSVVSRPPFPPPVSSHMQPPLASIQPHRDTTGVKEMNTISTTVRSTKSPVSQSQNFPPQIPPLVSTTVQQSINHAATVQATHPQHTVPHNTMVQQSTAQFHLQRPPFQRDNTPKSEPGFVQVTQTKPKEPLHSTQGSTAAAQEQKQHSEPTIQQGSISMTQPPAEQTGQQQIVQPASISQSLSQQPVSQSQPMTQQPASQSQPMTQQPASQSQPMKPQPASQSQPMTQQLASQSQPMKPASQSQPITTQPASQSEPMTPQQASQSEPMTQPPASQSQQSTQPPVEQPVPSAEEHTPIPQTGVENNPTVKQDTPT